MELLSTSDSEKSWIAGSFLSRARNYTCRFTFDNLSLIKTLRLFA
jgi:hypothetical protein